MICKYAIGFAGNRPNCPESNELAHLRAEVEREPTREWYEKRCQWYQQECDRLIRERNEALVAEARKQPNILKTVSSEWEHSSADGEVSCHSKMLEGVLCRWWGSDEPLGVALIDKAHAILTRLERAERVVELLEENKHDLHCCISECAVPRSRQELLDALAAFRGRA